VEADRLHALAVRIGRGDRAAAAELRRELEPGIVRMVRRVLRTRTAASPLAERILSEVRRLNRAGKGAVAPRVARAICQSLVDELCATPDCWPALRDTIRG
jgi:hypothetical protein